MYLVGQDKQGLVDVVQVDYGFQIPTGSFIKTSERDKRHRPLWIWTDSAKKIVTKLYEHHRDEWSVYLRAVKGKNKIRMDLFKEVIYQNDKELDTVTDATDRASATGLRYMSLVHKSTGRYLRWNGEQLMTVKANETKELVSASWSLQEVPGSSYYQIRTAFAAKQSPCYLVAHSDGRVEVKDIDLIEEQDVLLVNWQKQGTTRHGFRLLAAGSSLCLNMNSAGEITVKTLDSNDAEQVWALEHGFVDHTKWRSSLGQQGWANCRKCGGMFWLGNPGRCSESVGHGRHLATSERFILPMSDPFAQGEVTWRRCKKCSVLFDDAIEYGQFERKNKSELKWPFVHLVGACWDKTAHEADRSVSYTIATDKNMVGYTDEATTATAADYKRCDSCRNLFGPNTTSRCQALESGVHKLSTGPAHVLRRSEGPGFWDTLLSSKPDAFTQFEDVGQDVLKAFWTRLLASDKALFDQISRLKGGSDWLSDLRAAYQVLDPDMLSSIMSALDKVAAGSIPDKIDAKVWGRVGQKLRDEASLVKLVSHYFKEVDNLWFRTFVKAGWATEVVQKIIESENPPIEEAEVEWLEFVLAVVAAATRVIPAEGELEEVLKFTRTALEIIDASVKLANESSESDEAEGRDQLLVKEAKQYKVLGERFEQQTKNIARLKEHIISDWGRLQAIQELNLIVVDTTKGDSVSKVWLKGYEVNLYRELMPYRFYIVQGVPIIDYGSDRDYMASTVPTYPKGVLRYEAPILKILRKRERRTSRKWFYVAKEKVNTGGENMRNMSEWPSEGFMSELFALGINAQGLLEGTAGWETLEYTYGAYKFYRGDPKHYGLVQPARRVLDLRPKK